MGTAARIAGPGTAGLPLDLGGGTGWPDALGLIGLALLAAIWAGGLAWVVVDATRRSARGRLWAAYVGAGCLPIAGPLLYRLVRPLELLGEQRLRALELTLLTGALDRGSTACPSCGRAAKQDFMVCPHCGERLRSRCDECAGALEPTWAACPYCGTAREGQPPGRVEPRTASARGS